MDQVAQNLLKIKNQIAEYAKKYDRDPKTITLLLASKGQTQEKILSAYHAGQKVFGENYVQEALEKMAALPKDIDWHYIGPIQSNKTKKIAEHFSWVHSVDSENIAKRLNDQRPHHLPPLNICIEVNISHEATKSGIEINNLLPLIAYCQKLPNLVLRGLMTIPAPRSSVTEQRVEFHKLFSRWQWLREQGIKLDTLSMGMSEDFEAAIAEGATIVRIGTAVLGPRA